MSWYYVENGEQRGPVSDADLQAMAQAGSIQPQTLLWREGMSAWKAFQEIFQGAGVTPVSDPLAGYVACSECGRVCPPDEVIRHGNQVVCATCKPIFLQKLKEGLAPVGSFVYGGFWIRFGAKILDGIILTIARYCVVFLIGIAGSASPTPGRQSSVALMAMAAGLLLNLGYHVFFVGKYGATPGKMATKLRVIRADGSPVGYGLALGRYFAEYLSAFLLGIGYIMAGVDDQKRALHDRICNTRVVKV